MLRAVRRDLIWRRLGVALLAVSLTVAVAACGGDDDDAVETDTGAGDDTSGDDTASGGDDDDLYGGGEDEGSGGGDSTTEAGAITISGFRFATKIDADAGATIPVTNEDGVRHTVTADDEGAFNVSVDPGTRSEITAPSEPGEYAFHCEVHPTMTSTLIVAG